MERLTFYIQETIQVAQGAKQLETSASSSSMPHSEQVGADSCEVYLMGSFVGLLHREVVQQKVYTTGPCSAVQLLTHRAVATTLVLLLALFIERWPTFEAEFATMGLFVFILGFGVMGFFSFVSDSVVKRLLMLELVLDPFCGFSLELALEPLCDFTLDLALEPLCGFILDR